MEIKDITIRGHGKSGTNDLSWAKPEKLVAGSIPKVLSEHLQEFPISPSPSIIFEKKIKKLISKYPLHNA
jgi:hypothetical protein